MRNTTLDTPWNHKTIYAGHYTAFTRKMCLEQLAAHTVDNYETQFIGTTFLVYTTEYGWSSIPLFQEEFIYFQSRIEHYRNIRKSDKDWVTEYRKIPEYVEGQKALMQDYPDVYHYDYLLA